MAKLRAAFGIMTVETDLAVLRTSLNKVTDDHKPEKSGGSTPSLGARTPEDTPEGAPEFAEQESQMGAAVGIGPGADASRSSRQARLQDAKRDATSRLASYWVQDAFNGHLENGLALNMMSGDNVRFWCCFVQIHSVWHAVLISSSILHSLLIVFEPVWDSCTCCRLGIGYRWHCWDWTHTLQLLCVLLYTADILMKCRYMGFRTFMSFKGSKSWQTGYAIIVSVLLLDAVLNTGFRFARPLRPLVLVLRSRAVRRFYSTVLKTLPSLAQMGKVLALLLLAFSLVMVRLMRDAGSSFFTGSVQTLYDLGVLLFTLDNYEDLSGELFNAGRYMPTFFFFIFIVIGILFMQQLVLGTVHEFYCVQAKEETSTRKVKKAKGLLRAFGVLDEKKDGMINQSTFGDFLKALRPGDSSLERIMKFNLLANRDGLVPAIDHIDFLHLERVLDLHFLEHKRRRSQLQLQSVGGVGAAIYNRWNQLVICADMAMFLADVEDWRIGPLELNDFFQTAFVFDCWWELRKHLSLTSFWQGSAWTDIIEPILAAVLTLQVLLCRLLGWPSAPFCCLRALRIVRLSRGLRTFLEGIATSTPAMMQMLAFIFVVLYIFAVVGHDWLGQYDERFATCHGTAEALAKLMLEVDSVSLVEDVVAHTHPVVYIYFVSYYVATVMVVMNLIISLMLEFYSGSLTHLAQEQVENARKEMLDNFENVLSTAQNIRSLNVSFQGAHDKGVLHQNQIEKISADLLKKINKECKDVDLLALFEKKSEKKNRDGLQIKRSYRSSSISTASVFR